MGKPKKAVGKNGKKSPRKWVITIFILSFLWSILLSWSSSAALESAGVILASITVLLLVFINIVTDIIGMAVASAEQAPFQAMAAKKVKGAKTALWLTKNADRVSSVCNDVAGDICGIISGSAGAVLAIRIVDLAGGDHAFVVGILLSGVIAALTVGGKALGKFIAVEKSKEVVSIVGRAMSIFTRR